MADEASDEERFTAIYDACRQRVWAYAVSRAGRQVADEVVSETFAVAWRRLRDVPDPALPWLLGVARNVLRESYRAEARREAFEAELRGWAERMDARQAGHTGHPGQAARAGDIAEDVAERLAVLRAMAALPEGDREILILVAWQGLTPREAARVVGCTAAALRVRLHRARRRLVRAVEDAPAEPAPRPAGHADRARSAAGHAAAGVRPVGIISEERS
ncbi:RNA polymerase sigma factor [Actinomadura terrae]|uniref:RNA polymerase sigma factor n=1 Tax=Actinomadura terrae TaxID=604353 RepID=UPI001FA6EE05|nr:sigma-70 family RNA polymerase sigma factor [Actinomadura terrae]